MFQVTAAVVGALVLWVVFVVVRLPTRARLGAAKEAEEPAAPSENQKIENEDEKADEREKADD